MIHVWIIHQLEISSDNDCINFIIVYKGVRRTAFYIGAKRTFLLRSIKSAPLKKLNIGSGNIRRDGVLIALLTRPVLNPDIHHEDDVLVFDGLFKSISVISSFPNGDNERHCVLEHCLQLRLIPALAGDKERFSARVNHQTLQTVLPLVGFKPLTANIKDKYIIFLMLCTSLCTHMSGPALKPTSHLNQLPDGDYGQKTLSFSLSVDVVQILWSTATCIHTHGVQPLSARGDKSDEVILTSREYSIFESWTIACCFHFVIMDYLRSNPFLGLKLYVIFVDGRKLKKRSSIPH